MSSLGEARHEQAGLGALEVRGRYTVYGEVASGGMATIQYGRLAGPAGFARNVAIKRLHPQFARDPSFVSMFLDEARLAARIAHVNVISTLDVLADGDEVSLVMEYVHGESLAGLLAVAKARGQNVPIRVACTMLSHALHGLHAAHDTRGENGEPLGIVHRDVSPQNVIVGEDGIARVLDFGIAKAKDQRRVTPTGELKGKLAYMAPEQYRGEEVDRRVDVYGASVMFWEVLTGNTLFDGPNDASVARAVLEAQVVAPSTLVPEIPEALDRIVLRGLARAREERFETAREMARAIERDFGLATQSEVSDWVHGLVGDALQVRADALRKMQQRVDDRSQDASEVPGTRKMQTPLPPTPAPEIVVGTSATRIRPQLDANASNSLPAGKFRSWKWFAASLVLAMLGLGVVLAMSGERSVPRPVSAGANRPAKTIAQPPPPPPLGPTRPADAIAPQAIPAAISAPVTPPANEATPNAQDAKASQPGLSGADRKQKPKVSVPSKPRKDRDCSQPFVVDSKGIRRVKRECL